MLFAGCATTQETAPAAAPAAAKETPEWFYGDIVDLAFVKEKVTVPMAENVMVIDSRPYKAKYVKGHIPLAVSIPDTKFDKMTDTLPGDKNALLIFYCGGPT
jgi:hypothetical protein